MHMVINSEININCLEAKECLLKIESLTEYIISQISYLFKHESYKHENEARIIITKIRTELDDIKTVPGNLSKLYIYNNSKTYIDEIILGSKVENPENYLPLIFTHGAEMWEGKFKNQIKVTQSAIQYR